MLRHVINILGGLVAHKVAKIVNFINSSFQNFFGGIETTIQKLVNDAYEPIYSDNCQIQGVVIGLVRKL